MFFLVFFGSGVHKTQYRTPKDPKFVKVGVVMVNYENQWEKMENNDFFWLNGSVWCTWSLSTLL